jgi:pimeloyl-ACP methyl ester carboxylesterase
MPLRFKASHTSLWLAVALAALAASRTSAQRPAVTPEVLRTPAGLVETGVLSGAAYRIDVPSGWNHSLVMYYHGYAEHPVTFHIAEKAPSSVQPLLDRGYAVAESAYSRTGWALPEAYPETEMLRRYFIKAYGLPHATFLMGRSMGGALTALTLELNPKPYAGGLDLCGAVGPSYANFQRRFAWRAAFDFYFPAALPPPEKIPPTFEDTREVKDRLLTLLKSDPTAAAAMRLLTGMHTDAEVAGLMSYTTYVLMDMEQRAGGNPFDNRNLIYSGTSNSSSASDWALNDGVHRYTAAPRARTYLMQHFTPSGRVQRPMLAVHTVYDPIVPVSSLVLYQSLVDEAGFGRNYVQQYIHRDGHCTLSEEETGQAFDELVSWVEDSDTPKPGLLP